MRFERLSENLLGEIGEDGWEINSSSKFFKKEIIDKVIMGKSISLP